MDIHWIIFIIIVIIFTYFINYYKNYTKVKGSCGASYRVVNKGNKKEVADALCTLGIKTVSLQKYLTKRYPTDERTKRILKKYNNLSMVENPKETFTRNKGYSINMCMRDSNGNVYDESLLMFVLLHEIGHIITDEHNHTPKFWENNRWIMLKAQEAGLYHPVNYGQYPVMYCGININSSPLFN